MNPLLPEGDDPREQAETTSKTLAYTPSNSVTSLEQSSRSPSSGLSVLQGAIHEARKVLEMVRASRVSDQGTSDQSPQAENPNSPSLAPSGSLTSLHSNSTGVSGGRG